MRVDDDAIAVVTAAKYSAVRLNRSTVGDLLAVPQLEGMSMDAPRLLAVLALVLAMLSAVTVMPLWIPIVLLSLSVLMREGVRLRV